MRGAAQEDLDHQGLGAGREFEFELKEQPLSDDTAFNRGFQACHDIQFFMARKTALASCAGDAQLWDISDPWNPTANVDGKHTHIYSPSVADSFEFIHSGVVSWDGKTFAIMDETGGGCEAHCFGDASTDGFYYFYDMVKPGDPAPALKGRYTIPRNQASEICVSHNATVIPIKGRKLMSVSYYQGGVSLVDFTDPSNIREVGVRRPRGRDRRCPTSGPRTGTTAASSPTAAWAGAATRPTAASTSTALTGALGRATKKAKRWSHSNPQTQEAWQAP